ncbi:uncharacterized protein LOC135170952 [Diachasmimorpha longicaudata]|uniref:uncharacterized protein LOC135170952 n=1 Tax=Diachasmimorpha longicaudata TaxID=58733 RepID=UPI0030B8C61D
MGFFGCMTLTRNSSSNYLLFVYRTLLSTPLDSLSFDRCPSTPRENNHSRMSHEISSIFKKIDDTIIDLKMILEQVTELRVKCALMHVEILSHYQPLCAMVLDGLNEQEREMRLKEKSDDEMEE